MTTNSADVNGIRDKAAIIGIGETEFSNMHGRLKSDHARPLLVEMTVDLSVAEPVVKLAYRVPSLSGGEGAPNLNLDLPDGIFAGGDRDVDDEGDGGPAPGRRGRHPASGGEETEEDTNEED